MPIETVVVGRSDGVMRSSEAQTAEGMPNLLIKVLSPFRITMIRSIRVFLQTFSATVGVANITSIPALHAINFKEAAILALAAAAMAALHNATELFVKLDQTNPELRG